MARSVIAANRASEILVWGLIAALAASAAVLMAAAGLAFDWSSALRPGLPCAALIGGAAFYRLRRPDERIAATLVAVAQIVAFSAVAATFSYAVVAHGGPLWDARLAAWDRGIGLDWHGYLEAVDARPLLATVYNIAYASLIGQIVVAAGLLGLTGRFVACRGFVVAVVLAGAATIVISGLMPANTAFVHFGLRPTDVSTVDVSGAYGPLGPFAALRAGTLKFVSLNAAEGLITFPSFHAALGLIFLWAFWSVRWARWPALALNLTLIAATPVNGGHYFVDVAAGLAVAVLAIVTARRLAQPAARQAIEPVSTAVGEAA